jgi:hypothetical protein
VAGSLDEMGITDIIQILNMGIKTARVTITGEMSKGEIFVKNGIWETNQSSPFCREVESKK